MKTNIKNYQWKALGLGAVAGMRSLTAPAILSHQLSLAPAGGLQNSPLKYLQKGPVATGLKLLAASEMAGDKLPDVPDRITLAPILFRTAAGSAVGAAVFIANQDRAVTGAVLGGLAAIAATYGSFYLRRFLNRNVKLPNVLSGAVEDAITIGSGIVVTKFS
ncbi:DUF4126 family protein [Pontibacter harenae]|uniref:DUF4126 family protein n=1 Tax=Pontibacter harenae TaxID=2894083 RepID=UPI001E4865D4|nr:DUF4126 family protein [Pontibacter harenae]MCC9165487.1 DUF4126 family protein [Pontibacter harenae]